MHVPEENKYRYRRLKSIADLFETAGDRLGSEFAADANAAYGLSAKYKQMALALRVPGKNESEDMNSGKQRRV